MKPHYHWTVLAGDRDGERFNNFCDVIVEADSEGEAIFKAKNIVTRKDYAARKVSECYATDTKELIEAMINVQKETINEMKRGNNPYGEII